MLKFNTQPKKATGVQTANPTFVGQDLISLDSKYTKEYNYYCNSDSSVHLSSFWGINLATGGQPVARTLKRNYIKKFKKLSLIGASALLFMSNSAFSAGIPVIDAAAKAQAQLEFTQQIATWAKEASRWTETIAHYQKQIESYKNQLASQTGIRDSIAFLEDINQIYKDLHEAGMNVMDFNEKVLKDPNGFLNDRARKLLQEYTIFDRCKNDWMNDNQKAVCISEMTTRVSQMDAYNTASKQMGNINKDLGVLTQRLKQSKDIKESSDINAAIQLKIAEIQMVKNNLEIAERNYANHRSLRAEQSIQDYAKSFDADYDIREIYEEVSKSRQ